MTGWNRLTPLRYALAASAAFVFVTGPAPAAADPKAIVQGVEDDDLRDAIVDAIGETESVPNSRFDARRRAREAGEDAIAVLRSQGYYAYHVEADVADQNGDDGAGEREPPQPVVRIEPGPVFRFADPAIAWIGDTPIPEVQGAAAEAMDLPAGRPGRAEEVLEAEGRVLVAAQSRGYADARVGERQIIVDHADNTMRPTFRIEAGRLVRLNGVELSTEGRTNPAWVTRLAPWDAGDVYDPQDVAELERRLLDTGVYDAVAVALRPGEFETPEGYRPVLVSLTDRPPRSIELGVGFSTSEGVGVDARWTRYNRLRRADTLTVIGRLAEIEQRLEGRVSLPHWRKPQRTLTLAAAAYNEQTDAYDQMALSVSADLTRRYGKTSYLTFGAALEAARTAERVSLNNAVVLGEERDTITATLLGAFAMDRSDDPLDPRRGWRLEARAEPTLTGGDASLAYLRTQGQVTGYLPLRAEGGTVAAGRLKLGAILGGDIPGVPAGRRFYAGGGGSVRGYAYQAIGPRLSDNTPQGGLSLFEASIELRHRLTERWGVVGFVDAGAVGSETTPTGADYSAGAGIGVRYDLGFGPIRADIAVPLDKREGDADFQVYLSIGQSF